MSNKINEVNVEEAIEMKEVEATASEKFLDKAKGFIKKHGKKIAAGAAIIGGVLVAYAAGKNSVDGEDEDEDIDGIDYEIELLGDDTVE